MSGRIVHRSGRLPLALVLMGFILLLGTAHAETAVTGPGAPDAYLSLVEMEGSDAHCIFSTDCSVTLDGTTSGFTFDLTTGAGLLQSYRWPHGQTGTTGAGLIPYLYRIDMQELIGAGNPACITSLSLDFGPIVPLDYDGDGSLDHGFMVSDSASGVSPSSVTHDLYELSIEFSSPVCGDASATQNNGKRSFFLGLASPFRDREVSAELGNNMGVPLTVPARAPEYDHAPSLAVVPSSGPAGAEVQLIGSGYVPGGYAGTVRWNGTNVGTFPIPTGGAFSVPFTVPESASVDEHIVSVCSLTPCATGDLEQLAEAIYGVTEPASPEFAYHTYLPIAQRQGLLAPEPFSYIVDPTVVPSQSQLPGLDGGAPRPLAAIRDPRGTVSTFVVNELVLQTDDQSAVNSLLARTGGEVLLILDPEDAGLTTLPKSYLIRVNLSTADLAGLTEDVTALIDPDIKSAGRFAFSSNDATRLFAIAADEAVDGLTIGVNWLNQVDAIPDNSFEAPNGADAAYSPNAYNWPHFARGTTQDIGVPETWTMLWRAGRLGNRVDVAILDKGFFPNADFPSPMTYLSVVPFVTNPINVPGDAASPEHGTHVLQTVAARSNNDFGIVGVAAPIARPMAVYTAYDYFLSGIALVYARAEGADVLNMSFGGSVPGIFGWTLVPFEATTTALYASGALLFASAGNDGIDVDGVDCFLGICWEHTAISPCENAGVICVGGLEWNAQSRAPGSNFGAGSVAIYAPYLVYAGQAPSSPGGGATTGFVAGTSFASPYAAGVAALIWACNPSLSNAQVWEIMRTEAHSSPDRRVNRYVNAYAACLEAVGVSVDATILAPDSGSTHHLGLPVSLRARVGYVAARDGTPLQVEWLVDGNRVNTVTYRPGAGTHTFLPEYRVSGLAAGSHTALIRVTAGTAVVERSVTFSVVNSPPVASIDQPSTGASYCQGELVTLRGSAQDINQPTLPEGAFAWRSNLNGSLGTGSTRSLTVLATGIHTIVLRVTDNGGLWDEASINLTILAASHPTCADLAPAAVINSPANGAIFYAVSFDGTHWYAPVTFMGTVADSEDAVGELTVEWLSDVQGSLGIPTVNPTTGVTTITANMRGTTVSCSGVDHVITLRVTDSAGNVTEDQIAITISHFC